MTTEEKNKAILDCGDDYDDILDIQYGKTGTPERDRFDREAEAFIEGGAAQCGADAGAAGRENRHEEVVHLAHREREDGRAALHALQDFPGARQTGQHHHPVIGTQARFGLTIPPSEGECSCAFRKVRKWPHTPSVQQAKNQYITA